MAYRWRDMTSLQGFISSARKRSFCLGPDGANCTNGSRQMALTFASGGPWKAKRCVASRRSYWTVMNEKGFLDAQISHDMRPTYGNPRDLTLEFTIVEGKRSRRTAVGAPLLSPAQRCMR